MDLVVDVTEERGKSDAGTWSTFEGFGGIKLELLLAISEHELSTSVLCGKDDDQGCEHVLATRRVLVRLEEGART